MKRPKQLPAVERKPTSATWTIAVAGVRPSTLVGKRPSPACKLLADYRCQ